MKRNQYLPAHTVGFVLALLLWQTQVTAQTKAPNEEEAGRSGKAEKKEKERRSRTKSLHRARRRSAMRERARLYESLIAAAAAKHKVDPASLWTIAYLETRFRPNSRSPVGAQGMMQFMPGTARRFNLVNPYDAAQSIDAAARYVSLLTQQFGGRLDLVLAAYNSGETAVDCYLKGRTVRAGNGKVINRRGIRTGGVPPYKETQSYVRRGALVYARVRSAEVFSAGLLNNVRVLSVPGLMASPAEVASINSELADVGGRPAVLYTSATAQLASGVPAPSRVETDRVEGGFATVFFDVHSGARYLVQSGRIVKPLEAPAEDTPSEERRETKSVHFASRE